MQFGRTGKQWLDALTFLVVAMSGANSRSKPEAPRRGWGSSAAASKHANLGIWGPRSEPTEPHLFEAIGEFARRPRS